MAKCKRCLIMDTVPGSDLDADGICAFCRSYPAPGRERREQERRDREADLERTLRGLRGPGEYDVLVCLSGGKDSLYLLYKVVVEYGLRALAFTTDVNLPAVAWQNIRRTIARLGADHLVYRPSDAFYRKLFRHLLQNQEARGAVYTVSYVYAPLFEGDALKVAVEKRIPVALAGYSPGQPDPSRMVYEFSPRLIGGTDWTPPGLRDGGEFDAVELGRFWNPNRYPHGTRFPRYLAPFHAWEYNQEETMQKVVKWGLACSRRHASPVYSNYPINWLLMYSDLRTFGYNPYTPEFSALIREGKASRAYWRLMGPIVDFMIRNRVLLGKEVTRSLAWLGLSPESLRITRPRGAYDPSLSEPAG